MGNRSGRRGNTEIERRGDAQMGNRNYGGLCADCGGAFDAGGGFYYGGRQREVGDVDGKRALFVWERDFLARCGNGGVRGSGAAFFARGHIMATVEAAGAHRGFRRGGGGAYGA